MHRLAGSVLGLALLACPPAGADPVQDVLDATNRARAIAGCEPLMIDPLLSAAAEFHARMMAERNFFGHADPEGQKLDRRLEVVGYDYAIAAENVAAGYKTPQEAFAGWMASDGHRRNILNCAFREIGIGYAYQADDRPIDGNPAPYFHYWTQAFGLKAIRPQPLGD